jgi:3-deoxy-7-phosphoheptulonate synthase
MLTENIAIQVENDRKEICNILSGEDKRLLVIAGPCSAWPSSAVYEYAKRLKRLSNELESSLKLVMRVYIQKPRTTNGWAGPFTQPDPFSEPNFAEGRKYSRGLMLQCLDLGLALADEALFPSNSEGFLELLSWLAIGARSTENREHRMHASHVACPVGMKNPTSGSIEIGVNSIIAAQHSHTALIGGQQVLTKGNQFAHLVLRGGTNEANYELKDLKIAEKLLKDSGVKNPSILVDASHGNSRKNGEKDPNLQIEVIKDVLENLENDPELSETVKGFMIESFIQTGNQNLDELNSDTIDRNGLSITDPCLGWDQSESLIRMIAKTHNENILL